LISLDTKVNLAFFVSVVSILWNVVLYRKGRKLEKIRIYDKVYGVSESLLMYEYNNLQKKEYESHDKELENAVRDYNRSHDLAHFFGIGFKVPDRYKEGDERNKFCKLVQEEHRKYYDALTEELWKPIFDHNQSPVFCLDELVAKEKFDYVFKYVGENLSYFSQIIRENWHEAQNTTPEKVKYQYISLKSLNEEFCEPFDDEYVKDPYVVILKFIRNEYRKLTRTPAEKWNIIKWNVLRLYIRVKNITSLSKGRS
jgi:hypothetical protein